MHKTQPSGQNMKANKLILNMLLMGIMAASPILGQVKPADSKSKVKKVLLYNKIGGWVHVDGRKDVTTVLTNLSKSKGFALTVLEDDAAITLDFLKTFQAIVWDNNTDGGKSVPSVTARKAVIDYVNQGGGWYLIHGAADHQNSWPELLTTLGTTFTIHGLQGKADAILDPAAKADKELKWMVEGTPEKITLTDEWYSFQNTVRKLAGVTVVYTAGGAGPDILKAPADGSNDFTYIWAKPMGKGRMFYSAIGHGQNTLFGQVDSVVSKMLWQNVRYVAGDFQNGCINPASSNFDANARVDNGTCATSTILGQKLKSSSNLTLLRAGRKTQFTFPHTGPYTLTVRDMQGSLVKAISLPSETDNVNLDNDLKAGFYQLEARCGRSVAHFRVVLH
jgi:type 1 glutamine amidotransferase